MHLSIWTRTAAAAALAVGLVWSENSPLSAQAKYTTMSFYNLGNYNYNAAEPDDPTPTKTSNTIPASVRAFEGKRVQISGNTMALDYSSGFMSEFLLHPTADACEFGGTPRINEWIYVRMAAGQKVKISTGYAVIVKGTFSIKEEVERGRVVGLYDMVADSVQGR
jgi:hypothetical protein